MSVSPAEDPVSLDGSDSDVSAPAHAASVSRRRYRNVAFTAIASLGSKGIQFLTTIVSVPLTLHYLGDEQFGLWMTITSAIGMLAFADLGIGNGLLNAIAAANGNDDRRAAREAVSTGAVLLAGLATLLGLVFAAAYPFVDWGSAVNARSLAAQLSAGPAVAAVVVSFLLAMPLGIVQRVQLGYQAGFSSNLWQSLGTLLGLAGILACVHLRAGLPTLVAAFAVAPLGALAASGAYEFGRARPWLAPSVRHFSFATANRLFRSGALFFLAQTGALVLSNAPNLLIANRAGLGAVAPYNVAMRPIQMLALLTSLWAMPLWPAYGEAVARHDWRWIGRTFRRSVAAGGAIAAVGGGAFFLVHRWLLTKWVGPDSLPDRATVAACVIFLVGNSGRWTGSMLLNAMGRLRGQVVYQVAIAAAAIAVALMSPSPSPSAVAATFAGAELVLAACLLLEGTLALRDRTRSGASDRRADPMRSRGSRSR